MSERLRFTPVFHALERNSDKDILAGYTPEQQDEIYRKQKMLSSLAYFIGKDFRILVELNEPGAGWHWNFAENIIRIDPNDLLERPIEHLKFLISHEAGHRRISRTDFIPLEEWQQPGFSFMMNAIEDPRTNNFVAESYPRFREDVELAYQHDLDIEKSAKENAEQKLGHVPKHIQAGFEYIRQWFLEVAGEEIGKREDLPEDVKDVVKKTLEAARDSWWRYPSREEADAGEKQIGAYAKLSYEINRDQIWPEFKKLVEQDVEEQKIREEMKDQGLEEQAIQPLVPQDIREAMEQLIADLPVEEKKQLEERAKAILAEFERELNEQLEGKLAEDPERKADQEVEDKPGDVSAGERVTTGVPRKDRVRSIGERVFSDALAEMKREEDLYEKYRREVLPLIDKLETDLRKIFLARRSRTWETGFKTGKKIDIKKRIQEKAKGVPAIESKAWQKREMPQEKDYAVTVLADVSGSMFWDDKSTEVLKSVIVLAEVLNRLGIRVEILGVNDELKEYQTFGESMSKSVREHIADITHDSAVKRCNRCHMDHQATDIGWGTRIAAERLAREKADHKILITLSDFQLEESPKHPSDRFELGEMVKHAVEESGIRIVGLGVGRGTEDVKRYYPNNLANVDIHAVAENLANVIREAIANTGTH